jgi:hypothetical protein
MKKRFITLLVSLLSVLFVGSSFTKNPLIKMEKFKEDQPTIINFYKAVIPQYQGDPGELQLSIDTDVPVGYCQYVCVIVYMYRYVRFPSGWGWHWINNTMIVTIPAWQTTGITYFQLSNGEQVDLNQTYQTGLQICS